MQTIVKVGSIFESYKRKFKTLSEIKKIAAGLKKKGKRVVTLNGSFDILHVGHLYAIQKAKKLGDVLIVGINSNKSYIQYKDKRGPLIDEKQRAVIISEIDDVDYLFMFDETTPVRFLEEIKPDMHCNGAEYGKECIEAETVKKNGGKICILEDLKAEDMKFSTTSLIDRIIERYGSIKMKAVFLDRDGIINVDHEYCYKVEQFKLMDGIIGLLTYLRQQGYAFFIITNQSGIARGFYTEDDMRAFNSHLLNELAKHGISIEEIYFCPHHPDARIAKYKQACDCRKPGAMLFQRAKKEHNIDMDASWSIGDKMTDCIAGKKAGTKTILLKSKYVDKVDRKYVDFVVDNISEIRQIIK